MTSAKASVQVEAKERPIIFGAESVRAILNGRKTQTRRVFKFPAHMLKRENADWVKAIHEDGGGNWILWSTDAPGYDKFTKEAYPNGEGIVCPYGRPGDRLWVRETWALEPDNHPLEKGTLYRATDPGWDENDSGLKWSSPIFMPRDRSRITLELTGVRVERVQEITREDALAEGVREMFKAENFPLRAESLSLEQHAYAEAWDSLNLKRGFGWDKNPWVWVLSFRRYTTTPSAPETADGRAA